MPVLTALAPDDTAAAIGLIIVEKPTSIAVYRVGATLAAQTVRLETLGSQRQIAGQNGQIYLIDAMLLGYKNHPTVANTDVQAGDRFAAANVSYEVVIVMPAHIDCVQAYLRVRA